MNTKLLYVLVSSSADIYLEQAYVSMSSARFHMPHVHIVLLMDGCTENSLTGMRRRLLDLVSEYIVVDLPYELSGQNRSRILKTSARNYVNGDYLFIDCDTVVVNKLDDIDNISYEMCACRDAHSGFMGNPYRDMCIRHCMKLGCNIKDETSYYNSGVMYVKDTPTTRRFYKQWNANWYEGRKNGIFMDQPSLAKTNIQFNHLIKDLPDIWNCQILHGIKFLPNAKIVHYLCTSPTQQGDAEIFLLRERNILESVRKDWKIPDEIIDCFKDPFNGIPEKVHVLAGRDVELCQSDAYYYLKRQYPSAYFNIWNWIFKYLNLFYKLKNKLSKHV